ncbi:MAG: hypothetical protein HOL85_00220 [Rhodospirillaceae bacterium]|jgi:hypothetical protein|nr:hypothetical protein [Rhodospirillaceae bacterium]MBT6137448.1 hypothetical protein [Rhodospirillaceae bacterium]
MEGYDITAITASQLNREREGPTAGKQSFAVSLINMTFRPLSFARVRFGPNADWSDWFPIPETAQNCFTNATKCFEDGAATNILVVESTDPPFQLQLASPLDDSGHSMTGTWSISPNPKHKGQVIVCTA